MARALPGNVQELRINCKDCKEPFILTFREWVYLQSKGFEHLPKRCKICRANNRVKFGTGTKVNDEDFGAVWRK